MTRTRGGKHMVRPLWPLLVSLCLLAVVLVPLVGGWGGCQEDAAKTEAQRLAEKKEKEEQEKKKKEKEKPKPPFQFGPVQLQPGARNVPSLFLKPGHWVSFRQSAVANEYDTFGKLRAAVVDEQNEPLYIPKTPYRLATERPVALPKEQKKHLEMTLFVPPTTERTKLFYQLLSRASATEIRRGSEFFGPMPPYTYFIVVLARSPDAYTFLKTYDSVAFPWFDDVRDEAINHYDVVSLEPAAPLLLPSTALAWTSIAYLVWDDIDPQLLSFEQQRAMIDWLHWGGQLIVSGPDSLDGLKGSFLDPFLPATAGDQTDLGDAQLQEISDIWILAENEQPGSPLSPERPLSGVELKLRPAARALPGTGGQVVEGHVGRGRIVTTAFRLTERTFKTWHGYDSFINSVLLRRPPRVYSAHNSMLRLNWSDESGTPTDPRYNTQLRLFTRDGDDRADYRLKNTMIDSGFGYETVDRIPLTEKLMGGIGDWDSFSSTANAARDTLRGAAGIKVPRRWFVIGVLGLYLAILVPLNWFAFYVIGKVEWAWIAAPLLAIVFSVLVVWFAQLDIGFVRSQTELAVLELHDGYRRGHLTRYTALYTSLSSNYTLRFDTTDAVAQPFPLSDDFRLRGGQTYSTLAYSRHADEAHLSGFSIPSNTTGMVHSEQIVDLAGPIRLEKTPAGKTILVNETSFSLRGAVVVRARSDTRPAVLDWCRLGDLKPNESRAVGFQALPEKSVEPILAATMSDPADDRLPLAALLQVALKPATYQPGEMRLLARIDELMPGATVEPVATQVRAATLVLVHLRPGDLPPVRPDVNSRFDFADQIGPRIDVPIDEFELPE